MFRFIRIFVKSASSVAFFAFLLSTFFTKVYSIDQFAVDVSVDYKIEETGVTNVIQHTTVENLYEEYYAKSYSLSLQNINPKNASATYQNQKLSVDIEDVGNGQKTLTVNFPNAVVGKGQKRNFDISFQEDSFVVKTGEVWEIAIPRLKNSGDFRNYNVSLIVPVVLGKQAYVSPEPVRSEVLSSEYKYYFDKSDVAESGISAGFGEFQVFNFDLRFHLENPLGSTAVTQIALPPDTAYQKIYYDSINPAPDNIETDIDGNWIASYSLHARQRIDVEALGSVQLFSIPRRDMPVFDQSLFSKTLQPTKYWQADDPEIINLARELKTPRAIYDYVTKTLYYDYSRVTPNVERKGALGALQNPESSICMEFTDLFIAISRAAGIPAREVNGFAYTENPDIEPLSLVADVLHSWPEYWSDQVSAWVPVDPTWGSTTGGVDFFDKLDLRHFAFVIHGADSEKPYPAGSYKLGTNPEKDVYVSFGKLSPRTQNGPKVSVNLTEPFPFFPPALEIDLQNQDSFAYYNLNNKVYFDDEYYGEISEGSVLPFSSYRQSLKVPYSFLGIGTPSLVKIETDNGYLEVPTNRNQIIVYNFVALVVIIIIVVFLALVRFKKLKLPNAFKIRKNHS